ncbi:MAG: tetratricopeptide repeat protein [Candidatus Krumholzibacteriia bacterium]
MSEQTVKAPLTQAAPTPAPEAIIALVQAGKQALADGDLDAALERFEEVIRRFPDSREGHNNLGALFATLGRHERAEACFTRVLELSPDVPNVHYNRGISRIRLRRYADAAADFQAVLKAQPTDADSWNNLGVAHFLQGEHAAAAANFRQALALTPNYPSAVLNLTDAELARGATEAAIAACERFLDGRSDPEVGRRLVTLLSDEAGRLLGRAATAAQSLLTAHGDDGPTRESLARADAARGALLAARGAAD